MRSLWAKPAGSVGLRDNTSCFALWCTRRSLWTGKDEVWGNLNRAWKSYLTMNLDCAQQASSPFGGVSGTGMFGAQVGYTHMLSSSNGAAHNCVDARAHRGPPHPRSRSLRLDQQRPLLELHRWRLVPPAPLG